MVASFVGVENDTLDVNIRKVQNRRTFTVLVRTDTDRKRHHLIDVTKSDGERELILPPKRTSVARATTASRS